MSDYEKFRLQWMLDHGHSLRELMEELQSLQYDDPEDSDRISTPHSGIVPGMGAGQRVRLRALAL